MDQQSSAPSQLNHLASNRYLNDSIRRLQNGLDCYTEDAPEYAEIAAALSALRSLQHTLPAISSGSTGGQQVVIQPISGIRVRADGDANFFHLLEPGDWVAAIQLNGKFTTPMQEAIMAKFADVFRPAARVD
ncbi:TPA: hypothetical protein QDB23_001678 [Burkholderia vietnamiensis]|nr:hypothetical protein [Burkholderia vietnamiensis]